MSRSSERENCTEVNLDVDTSKESFYTPLCLSGYLTPLQRKKLREKRNLDVIDTKEYESNNLKKIKLRTNAKKNHSKYLKNVPVKTNKPRKLAKENNPNMQYSVTKVIHTPAVSSENKKFFKTDTCSRLEKATFTFSLISKKNILKLDQNKEIKKGFSSKQEDKKSSNCQAAQRYKTTTSPNFIKVENMKSRDTTLSENDLVFNNQEVKCNNLSPDTLHDKTKQDLFDFDWPSDDILFTRQERARKVHRTLILRETNNNTDEKSLEKSENAAAKFFPIFYGAIKRQPQNQFKRSSKSVTKSVKHSGGGDQLIIDAGQKEIGAKVCNTCNMIYTAGQEEDETLHSNYHDTYLNLRFTGWKDENVIAEYADGRVILVKRDEKSFKLKKIHDVLEVANRDLGFPNAELPSKPDLTFLLYVSNEKRIIGLTLAEPISSASKLMLADNATHADNLKNSDTKVYRIGNWYSSSEKFPAICGVNRIWVDRDFRCHKIASRMIDCLRCHFIYGHVIGLRELAFTDPSPDGREFAAAYTGTDNFLVYR